MLSLSILHHLREPLKEIKYVRFLSKYFYFFSGFSIKQVGDFAEQRHLTLKGEGGGHETYYSPGNLNIT